MLISSPPGFAFALVTRPRVSVLNWCPSGRTGILRRFSLSLDELCGVEKN